MRQYVVRSARHLGPTLDLALISFVALYFEMIAIRWLASDVRVFAYLKNLPLLAAFLGLGIGCARAAGRDGRGGRDGIRWFPPLCLAFAAVVVFAEPLGLVHLYFPQEDFWAWNDANFQPQHLPGAWLAARFFAVVLGLFLLVVALFATLGTRLGALFDVLPPTRAYAVNLAASLVGIWAFAALSWLGWPPAGWFAVGIIAVLRFFAPGRPLSPPPPLPHREKGGGRPGGPNPSRPSDAWSIPRRTLRRRGGAGYAGDAAGPRMREPSQGSEAPVPPSFAGKGAGGLGYLGPPPSFAGKGAGGLGHPGSPSRGRRGRWDGEFARSALAVVTLGVALVLVALGPGATRWSPYYRIDLSPYLVPDGGGGQAVAGQKLAVNHDYHQNALDLSDAFVRAHPALETPRLAYDLPYRFAEPRRVLIVGAGLGNDVAAALRHGAQRVDAVEIDPAILALGRDLHPERPYGSPRVRAIDEDARAYLARTDEQYDLIVFGLLDSHTLLSSLSSLRLDSYVYTSESLEQARARLTPDGHLALAFAASVGGWDWLAARLYQMVATAFDAEPVALSLGYDVSTLYVVGPNARDRVDADAGLAALEVDPARLRLPVPPATDDWPFLYLRDHSLPLLPYGVMLALLLVVGSSLVLLALRGSANATPRPNALDSRPLAPDPRSLAPDPWPPTPALNVPMFLLGAAFMLLETKSISQFALLFGSTWLVNALVISAILVLALAANLFVAWRRPVRLGPAYALLALTLLLDQVVPLSALGGQEPWLRAGLGSLLLALPLAFAGVVFATLFARTATPSRAFGSNLLGALAGGLLEYASMITGFRALGLVALALYAASWVALRRRPLLARARGMGVGRRERLARGARIAPR